MDLAGTIKGRLQYFVTTDYVVDTKGSLVARRLAFSNARNIQLSHESEFGDLRFSYFSSHYPMIHSIMFISQLFALLLVMPWFGPC